MLIKNANIVLEDRVFFGDIRLDNGIITEIGENLYNEDVLDAKSMYLIPGGIDVHTHFDLDVKIAKSTDDFYTGSVAAACGGTTTIIDHIAFGPKGCPLDYQIKEYHKKAKGNAVIDYGFHGVIQHFDESVSEKMEELIDEGITSYKIYMTYDFMLKSDDILSVFKRAKELGLVICVHPEDNEMLNELRNKFIKENKLSSIYHAKSRPVECEAKAIEKICKLSLEANCPNVYIVHLSNEKGLNVIKEYRLKGLKNIYVETCPQYIVLDDSLYYKEDSIKYILSPPLRNIKNQLPLKKGLKNNDIQVIGTDHCPFNYNGKKQLGKNDFSKCPNGIPGVELRLSLMITYSELGILDIVKTCCTNPAKIFGIYPSKGTIKIGSQADIVLLNMGKRYTISKNKLHENVDYTPYEGMDIECEIDSVFYKGNIIVKNNEYIGKKGSGEFLKRGIKKDDQIY